jgi:hypothetical protein
VEHKPAGADCLSDNITLLLVDFKIALTDPSVSLAEKISDLKNTVHQGYTRFGSPQEEIWVVAHRVTRYT